MKRRLRASLLLEVVLGLGVFAVAFLLSVGVFPGAQKALAQSKNYLVATDLARQILEERRALGYSGVVVGLTGPIPSPISATVHGVQAATDFEYEVLVTEPFPAQQIRDVLVTVRWREAAIVREVRLESYVAQY